MSNIVYPHDNTMHLRIYKEGSRFIVYLDKTALYFCNDIEEAEARLNYVYDKIKHHLNLTVWSKKT